MAYHKRKESAVVTSAKKRLQVMKEIDKKQGKAVEYGDPKQNPLNSSLLDSKIQVYEKKIEEINQLLSQLDGVLNEEKNLAVEIRMMNTGVLQGAKVKFGPDSSEVEKLGGTRASERKKPARKKKEK